MIDYEFTVDTKRFNKRIKSDIQHKLRVALKCYTILNFLLNEDRSFTFNAKYRQSSTKIVFIPKNKDGTPITYSGKYESELVQPGIMKVTLIIDFKNKQ